MFFKIKNNYKLTLTFLAVFAFVNFLAIGFVSHDTVALSAEVQCKNIKNSADKKKCQEYIAAYNKCDSKTNDDAKSNCRTAAYNNYLDSVCGKGTDNASIKCRDEGMGDRYIADVRNGGGKICASGGDVVDGCTCPAGEEPKNTATTGQPPKMKCVKSDSSSSGDSGDSSSDSTSGDKPIPPKNMYDMSGTKSEKSISDWINTFIAIFSGVMGVGAVVMIIYAGILYSMAKDDANNVARAKSIITSVVIGLIAWGLLWAFINWIVPGGVGS